MQGERTSLQFIMTSFIIVSSSSEHALQEAQVLCQSFHIDPLDITILNPTEKKEGASSSLGIEEVKRMQQKVSLKPIKSTTKAVILTQAELLTIPAQNALLKLLEEPPDHTILILTTRNLQNLLPTIHSRCDIRTNQNISIEITSEEKEQLLHQAKLLYSQSLGEALRSAEQLAKNKQTAVSWLEKIISLLHEELIQCLQNNQSTEKIEKSLILLQKAYTPLKSTNANPSLLLENLFLSLKIT